MRYWWVNQNQTYRQEVGGGYLWSPKRKANGDLNHFYENMRVVAPGDIVLSFADTLIRAIGIATSHGYESPKPEEFGAAGPNWDRIGWRVDVRYDELADPPKPSDHMTLLGPLLPPRYSPLQASGRGNQGVYLTELPLPLANALLGLAGHAGRVAQQAAHKISETSSFVSDEASANIVAWEDHVQQSVESDRTMSETERRAVVLARRGQGLFKENVRRIESRCRVTGVNRLEHLIASHIKPWRNCGSADERLDGENGFLLTPTIDHLFDRGFITFEDSGRLVVSPVADGPSLRRMGVDASSTIDVGSFTAGQREYLDYHRDQIFLDRADNRR